jgi:hypothetical protein
MLWRRWRFLLGQENQGDQNYLGLVSVNIASKVEITFHFETPGTNCGGCRGRRESKFCYPLVTVGLGGLQMILRPCGWPQGSWVTSWGRGWTRGVASNHGGSQVASESQLTLGGCGWPHGVASDLRGVGGLRGSWVAYGVTGDNKRLWGTLFLRRQSPLLVRKLWEV